LFDFNAACVNCQGESADNQALAKAANNKPMSIEQSSKTQSPEKLASGLTSRALILSLIFIAIGNYWLKYTGLITHSGNFAESVPPIPAVAALIVMVAVNPALQRFVKFLSLSQAEIIVVYSMVAIAISMSSIGMIRYFLPVLTAPFYYATPENEYDLFNQYLPSWFALTDKQAIIDSYEGIGRSASIPWGAWALSLTMWTLMFIAFFWTMLCLVVIFRRQWMERERLVFPVARFALEITGDSQPGWLIARFFRNPYMWIGFGLSFFYNLLNILHAFDPSLPAPGKNLDLGVLFTERPWNAMRPISFQFRPEIFGLAYLMPLDVNFSVWFFYFLLKVEAVVVSAMGYNLPGFPYVHDQSSGAFLALAIAFFWIGKEHIRDVVARAFGSRQVDDRDEPLPYRVAFFGAIGGFAFICAWCMAAGMSIQTAALYFFLLLAFALVYSKIRAESGAPMIWLFPYGEHKRVMLNAFGPRAFIHNGSFQNLSVFASLTFLSRGYFPSFMAYQLEAVKFCDDVRMSRRVMAFVIMLALVVGLAAGYQMHLDTFYEYGSNILEGGDGIVGGTRGAGLIRQEYNILRSYLVAENAPDYARTGAVGFGFIFTILLAFLRRGFLQFPLHPLGFAMVTAYGDPLWGAFLSAWALKILITRFGGFRLYRRLIPGFLGVALGHFFTAGILWGILGTTGNEIFRRYGVWFG
jgi:hypothetical protein